MRVEQQAFDFIGHLNGTSSAVDVGLSFQRFVGGFGFTNFIIGRITPSAEKQDRGEMWAQSWPSDWYQIWTKKYYRVDPMVERARRIHSPFRWADLQEEFRSRGLPVFEAAKEFGIYDGLSASYPLADGAVAGITMGTPKYDLDASATTTILLALAYCGQKLASLAHQPPPLPSLLTARERECLCWVAAGKTDWDISEILCISSQTVHKHISGALRKLGAHTRAHAVAIALANRQLEL